MPVNPVYNKLRDLGAAHGPAVPGALAALSLGATELATAERAGRELTTAAPFRESGFRLLMQALTARGNSAEAPLVYDQLVQRLRDELGFPPSAETRVLHASILRTPP